MVSLVGSKVILGIFNFLLLVCGFTLIIAGLLILFDSEKVLLSRLMSAGYLATMPHPLLHYIAVGISLLGLILTATGILGCWAACMGNYVMLTFYFLIIFVALVGECAIYTVAWAWPSCMGLGVDVEEMTKSVQRNYGISGQEQFTVAVDLAQTFFSCCGIESANEYDTSLWRLQPISPSLAVPKSCCKLSNIGQPRAYLNPEPIDTDLCQALEAHRHQGYRHVKGCRDTLERWYANHYFVFLVSGFVVVVVEFAVLLSTILSCTRIYHHDQETKENLSESLRCDGDEEDGTALNHQMNYRRASNPNREAYSNETYAQTGGFTENV